MDRIQDPWSPISVHEWSSQCPVQSMWLFPIRSNMEVWINSYRKWVIDHSIQIFLSTRWKLFPKKWFSLALFSMLVPTPIRMLSIHYDLLQSIVYFCLCKHNLFLRLFDRSSREIVSPFLPAYFRFIRSSCWWLSAHCDRRYSQNSHILSYFWYWKPSFHKH